VTVFPCGKEDGSHVSNKDEMPYEIKMHKKMNENSLKEIFGRNKQLWKPIFENYMYNE